MRLPPPECAGRYEAFGPLYGSIRDSFAPICAPQGDLFEPPAWQQLSRSLEQALSAASSDAGWHRLALRATTSPRDVLKALAPQASASEQGVDAWNDDQAWPKNQRQQALTAIEPARQATSRGLPHARGLSVGEALQVTAEIVGQWLSQRLGFIGESAGGE